MSDKLWRKKHEFVVDKNGEVFVKLNDGTYDIIWVRKNKPLQDVIVFSENGIKFIEEYCYLDDLIAQADKAERLQKAVKALKDFITKLYLNGNITDEQLARYKNTLKRLIKGE